MRRLIVLLVAGLAAACSSTDATDQPLGGPAGTAATAEATSDAAAPTASAPATPDAAPAVLAGYGAYWTALLHAHAAGDPGDPQLRAHATGTALTDAQSGITSNTARGVRMKGAVTHKPTVTAVSATAATVTDCVDLRAWLAYDVPSGRRDPSIRPIGRVAGTYELTNSAGTWLVTGAEQGNFC